jgi:hypothetical protein
MKNKVSVVVTSYRDRGNLNGIIERWESFGVPVYLADGNNLHTQYTEDINHYWFYPDPGNKIRFATAQLTATPWVLLADDDVMPEPGLLNDFWEQKINGFNGIIGRKFNGDDYRKTPFFRADKLDSPEPVGFVGVMYFVPRDLLIFDYADLRHRAVDDLFWQMDYYKFVEKQVIATKNYKNLPECNDEQSIFKTPESREYRENWYRSKYNEVKDHGLFTGY